MTTAALFILLFGCMMLGMPIALALGLSSIATILMFSQRLSGVDSPEVV